jgi:hypothetical protein
VACDNPCNEIPYKALTQNEKDAIRAWELMDSGDPALRAKYLGSGVTVTSAARGGGGEGQGNGGGRGAGAGGRGPAAPRMVGAPPALFSRVWDFGDAQVSVMLHADYGARPYWASRVHFLRDGVWRMEESYHTTVQAAPRLTAIPPQPQQQSSNSN